MTFPERPKSVRTRVAIIVPALNEAACLPSTLDSIRAAAELLRAREVEVETVVVDNDSDDETASVARAEGATVVREPVRNIARARNTGARHAAAEVLVFVDADVLVPPSLFDAIHAAMGDSECVGGGVDVDYRPRRLAVRLYLRAWRLLARALGMAQGAAQFCRRSAFEAVGGYDERAWMGEDVDFYWALRRLARETRRTVRLLDEPRVVPSCRRFDQWPLWKTLIWTNPLFIALFRRWRPAWSGWYSDLVR